MTDILNYEITSISETVSDHAGVDGAERKYVIVDFTNRNDGSIYRCYWQLGYRLHIDFKFHLNSYSTAGTTITPITEEAVYIPDERERYFPTTKKSWVPNWLWNFVAGGGAKVSK